MTTTLKFLFFLFIGGIMRLSVRSFVVFAAALFVVMGCGTTRIQVPTLRPAEINTGGFKRIVVAGFKNTTALSNEGDQLEYALSRRLVESGRFTVLDKLLFENQLKAGVNAQNDVIVLSGVVNEYTYNEGITESKPYTNKEGKTFVDYQRNGSLRLGVSFQVSRASDAKILGARSVGREINGNTRSTNAKPAPLNVSGMVADAREQIAAAFLKKIIPFEEMIGVDFYSEKTIPELDDGIAAAQRGDWETAVNTFGRATDKYAGQKQAHVAWYNLALAYQCVYRFTEAEQAFDRALQLDPSNAAYRDALNQCRQMSYDFRKAQEQGG
jgi:tetratricopeptide (TPR) repeat protein